MVKFVGLTAISVFQLQISFSQIIPSSKRVDWSHAGLMQPFSQTQNIADVTSFGAVPNDNSDDYSAIVSAINSLNGQLGIVYFPAGVYDVHSTINLTDSLILKGAGADSTSLVFDLNYATANCINISRSQTGAFTSVTGNFSKGSFSIIVSSAAQFSAGDFAELRQANGSWDTNPAAWAVYSAGQIVKIDSVSVNELFLADELRMDYDSTLSPEIRKITPIMNCGIECLSITRVDSTAPGLNYGIYFWYAVNGYLRGVESIKSIGAHAWSDASSQIEITGCYFHESYDYDGAGTHGYGIALATHTTNCLIENNIFRHLRHAMMIKQGANGNVFGYNYSIEPTRPEFPTDAGGDISVHGHYPYSNLFEGNIVQNVHIDQSWGPSGPFNTFFRNRIELYGLIMTSGTVQSDAQNFAGNDITDPAFLHGLYILAGTNHFEHGNRVKGVITPAGTGTLNDTSYYLSSQPAFWNIAALFPDIGLPNPFTGQTIPARERYLAGDYTVCDSTTTGFLLQASEDFQIIIQNNPAKDEIFLLLLSSSYEKIFLELADLNGKILFRKEERIQSGKNFIRINVSLLSSGVYLLKVADKNKAYHKKVVID